MIDTTFVGILAVASMGIGYVLLWFLWRYVFREKPAKRAARLAEEQRLREQLLTGTYSTIDTSAERQDRERALNERPPHAPTVGGGRRGRRP